MAKYVSGVQYDKEREITYRNTVATEGQFGDKFTNSGSTWIGLTWIRPIL